MKKSKLYVVLTAVILLLIALPIVLIFATDEVSDNGGLKLRGAVEPSTSQNYSVDTYEMANDLDVMPTTLEAWVYVPASAAESDLGTLYGNLYTESKYGVAFLNFEIAAGGVPKVRWEDANCGTYDIPFEESALPVDEWSHLTIVYNGEDGVVSCYVNGELSEEKCYYPAIDPDVLLVPMYLGGDKSHMNTNYFKGEIGDITVYSDVRSADEVSRDYALGMEMTKDNADLSDAICYYDIDSSDLGRDIIDESGNGRDMIYSKRWLTEDEMADIRKSYGFTPAYSFAIIGDIQTMTDYYPEQLPDLYKWIVDNKDSKNIVFSNTLGDITNDNGRDDSYSKDENGIYHVDKNGAYIQWDVAYDAITQMDGELIYSIVRGNHDVYPDYNGVRLEGYNTYFENSEFFTSNFEKENGGGRYGDGQFDSRNDVSDIVTGYANSYANTFLTFTVGENEYLVLNLDWILKKEIIDWANNVIEAHPDHKVIICTHAYLNGDGTTTDPGDLTPRSSYNGDVLWTDLVSKYPNVEFVLSGHIGSDNIEVTQTKSSYGNTVNQILIDHQSYDAKLGGCGMVAMFYFDESGTKLAVEWYSVSKNMYYKNINQFTIDVDADAPELTVEAWDGATAIAPAGKGTEANPYLIANAGNLYWISKNIAVDGVSFAGTYFKQTADIDLAGNSMPSIGTYYVNSRDMAAFGGIYDGCGYSIMNGTIAPADDERSFAISEGYGLFGVIFGATIKNVVLDDVQIIGRGVTGGIVGRAAAPTLSDTEFYGFNSIIGCKLSENVKIVTVMTNGAHIVPKYWDDDNRAGRVGSVCGMAYSTLISGCISDANILLSDNFTLAGGIVGTAGLNSAVEYCAFNGKISIKENNSLQNAYIGGILGAISPNETTADIFGNKINLDGTLAIRNSYSDCDAVFDITKGADKVYYGGIAGFFGDLGAIEGNFGSYPYVIENCYSISALPSGISASGIVGYATAGEKTLYLVNCYTASDVSGATLFAFEDGNTTVDGLCAIVAENCGTAALESLTPAIGAIDSTIASYKDTDCAPIWIVGKGAPTTGGVNGLKYLDASGNVYYSYSDGTWSMIKNINIKETSLDTEYGTISSKYQANTMVVFLYDASSGEYSCIGGSNSIYDVLEIARSKTQNAVGAKVVIYFRGDVDFTDNYTNLSYSLGTIVFDLNGNTLYQAIDGVGLFSGHAKVPLTCSPTAVNVKNGNIVLKSAGLFHQIGAAGGNPGQQYEVNTTDTNYKIVNFVFEGVNISLAEGATVKSLIGTYADHKQIITRNAKMGLNVTFDDNCVIDITNAPADFVLFDACDPIISGDVNGYKATNSIVNISVGACEIKAENSFVWHKTNAENGSSVLYTKDREGKFFTLSVPSSLVPDSTSTFAGEYGYVFGLEKTSDTNGTATYTLGAADTPYGNIPEGEDYVFVIYRGNADGTYTYVKGYDGFAAALAYAGNNVAKYLPGGTCVIYMTRSAGTGTANDSGNNGFNIGNMIIDLGGNTLTQENSEPLIRVHPKYDNAYSSSNPDDFYLPGYYQFINGNIVLNNGLFYVGTEGSGYNNNNGPYPKTVYWTLDGINISLAEGADVTNVISSFRNCTSLTNGQKDIIFDLTIKDNCTLDITGVKDGNKPMLFNANDLNGTSDNLNAIVKIKVEGLSIIAKDYNFDWQTVAENGSSVTYVNNNSVTVTVSGNTYTREQIYTPYGNVSAEYIGMNFVVFKYTNGEYTCVYGNDNFATALTQDKVSARAYCANPGTKAVVYMLNDYVSSSGISGNLCYINGTMIIDLGGHTLTQGASEPIFRAYAKCGTHSSSNLGTGTEHTGTFEIINGNIKLNNHGLFAVGMEGGSAYAVSKCHKTLDWTLDNVNISLVDNATLTSVFVTFKDLSGYAPSGYDANTEGREMCLNLTINENCTIDISNANKKVTLFNAADSTIKGIVSGKSYCVTNSQVNITVLGCKIISSGTNFVWSEINTDNNSSVKFSRTENGNYMSFVISKASAASMDTSMRFKTADGTELVLVKISEDDNTVTYRLRPVVLADIKYTPKMSITLDEAITVNVYVPEKYLTKFTLDGNEYIDLTEIVDKKVTIDSEIYYRISIPLSITESLRSINLSVNINVNGTSANGSFTFDIIKYAKKVSDGAFADVEKQMVLDALSYARAAYVYFEIQDADAIARVDAILGSGYDDRNAPEFSGSAAKPTSGLVGATFILASSPTLRFYIDNDADASVYKFFVDGKMLSTKSGDDSNGKYIEMDVYAYQMSQTITYTINDVEVGSYHIKCYYEFALSKNDPKLTLLFERFARYCESAAEFKEAMITGEGI